MSTDTGLMGLLNEDSEVVVQLADGWSLRSGVYDKDDPEAFTSGEYVRLVDPDGIEYCYWDESEWHDDPALVMGAILNSAAGFRMIGEDGEYPSGERARNDADTDHRLSVKATIKDGFGLDF